VQVLDAVRAQAPELLDKVDDGAATRLAQGTWWGGAVLSVAVVLAWFLLATAHPGKTYHVAPVLVAAAWPITRRWRTRVPLPCRAAAATALGATVGLAASAVLANA
jgi:glutathione S-transferase